MALAPCKWLPSLTSSCGLLLYGSLNSEMRARRSSFAYALPCQNDASGTPVATLPPALHRQPEGKHTKKNVVLILPSSLVGQGQNCVMWSLPRLCLGAHRKPFSSSNWVARVLLWSELMLVWLSKACSALTRFKYCSNKSQSTVPLLGAGGT